MKLTRKQFLTGVAAAGIAPRAARAAAFTYKLAHDNPTTHPMNIRAVAAAEQVGKESGGRLVVQVYPNSQLGGSGQMLAQLRSGALEMMFVADTLLAQVVPAASVTGLPFVFTGYGDLWPAMDGAFGDYIHAQIEKIGLHCFEKGWDDGFRHVFTVSKPVRTPDDIKGLKIRVPEAPIIFALFKALGASPTTINSNEFYTALQTHLVDGGEQPLISLVAAKYYEVSKYVSLTNHMPDSNELLANGAAWKRLPKELQEILARNFNAAGLLQRADIASSDQQLTTFLKGKGMEFIVPDNDAFRAVIEKSGLYAQWREKYDPVAFDLLEKSLGKKFV